MVSGVRRKYKKKTNKNKKFLPGEERAIQTTIILFKIAGYTHGQIASGVGISKSQVKNILDRPEVAEELITVRESIPRAARELIEFYTIEAVQAIVNVMRVADDPKFILMAAFDLLDRGGNPKSSKAEKHEVNENRTTFTDDGIVDKLREASPEVQEEAAGLIERLEQLLSQSVSTNGDHSEN